MWVIAMRGVWCVGIARGHSWTRKSSSLSQRLPKDKDKAAFAAPYTRRVCFPNVKRSAQGAVRRGKHNDHGAWGET